ncbi:hypothetical protein F990_00805 [Acinetobacter tjernbergiae DSM 14971 = CIP 107465]|uniref:Uncharacterized protein n=2 Tax=Acinetobacter tjernbergiae TaxID=202955 RepID=V2UPR7_9GAMM|nr:hypothetical protein [Acinetobacter tjernbergiae]ESK56733.1 hypothetical protein F990_00805 [Acinetobacter tjernbergiae DSM 14971 = CIP 107465]
MQRMNKSFDFHTTLIIIYLALVAVSIALYALIQIFVDDKSTASNLLGWSATLFATIALLYTFNTWREQKGSEALSKLSENLYSDLIDLNKKINQLHRELSERFPVIAVNKETMQKFPIVNRELEEFGGKLNIIVTYKNDEILEQQLSFIKELIEMNQEVLSKWVADNDDLNKYNSDLNQQIVKFFEEFNAFKMRVDKVLMDYIFHKK